MCSRQAQKRSAERQLHDHWTQNDTLAYNIRVEYQDATTFFQSASLPLPLVDNLYHELLTLSNPDEASNDEVYTLLRTLDLATTSPAGEESAVDDFAVNLFRMLGYAGRGRVALTRKAISLFICGEDRHVKTDVCILNNLDILLLVQEDKRYLDGSDPETQLIAEAIAAFRANNDTRVRALGQAPLERKVLPGITMKGTMPIFYKIPVTAALVKAVQLGQYPAEETVVYAHLPEVPRPARRYSEGMRPLNNRQRILSYYEAFRRFI
ncbi:uncharacterized protein LAESUDRAFT_809075 [Laetiporus sulphureus 93-53]|uniref:Uncharacterized protein n=1 Tax=Laetiporus sulphureus 93-53 TaxID=1314785 RepID=A0A165HVX9_9APHY|nr:uncharacterized protein LAESUDRAFT_809075 [Laetiporus sulphureus 93-53]KZT12262.1 hypothetical protein LAESUDRAFT_809075 [Laetiporus sulphureus 93-53]